MWTHLGLYNDSMGKVKYLIHKNQVPLPSLSIAVIKNSRNATYHVCKYQINTY